MLSWTVCVVELQHERSRPRTASLALGNTGPALDPRLPLLLRDAADHLAYPDLA